MSRTVEQYDALAARLRQTALLRSCGSVLGWDEQTYLPPGGVKHRSEQLALLAGKAHAEATDPGLGDLLAELQAEDLGDEDGIMAVNVREAKREYDRATCLPRRLVEELSRVTTLSQQAWVKARSEKEFSDFLPWLTQVVELKREEAAAVGFGDDGEPYDALLDHYEPGATSAWVDAVFAPLRTETVALLDAIRGSQVVVDTEILTRVYPVESQRKIGMRAAEMIGFSFDEGRLDVAAHPFCSGFGPGDCRLTTRYDSRHFPGAFFGTMHEAGHGIYEQGLDREVYGTALGDSCSLGIHESQSRMWENFVGRSEVFWEGFYEETQATFPEALGNVSREEFVEAINAVGPSMIRVEADEVTYNLHIMLRFELERELIRGALEPGDVPSAWNEAFARDFGITPADDSEGCMQDIHWSAGLIGYFPTYALGNIYAAQFFNAANRSVGPLEPQFARGDFEPLKGWLNNEIHRKGRQFPADQLVKVVTGEGLSHEPLVEHLNTRFRRIYQL
ncbi:MAG: carboxypeptidase M32 [Planctomycetota bacterium]|nr:carboxypeptidase M32 [Planctomycetota bacterium]